MTASVQERHDLGRGRRSVLPRSALADFVAAQDRPDPVDLLESQARSRISDLVMAVKKFAYDEKAPAKILDVHDSLQSTLTILGHKLRLKQIHVEKRFEATPSIIYTRGSALSQVWTNLIDNAVDASPSEGQIEISTWTEPGSMASD